MCGFWIEPAWGMDLKMLTNDDLSFALGKDGTTRKKLAKASGGILEYIGNVAYMPGLKAVHQVGKTRLGKRVAN